MLNWLFCVYSALLQTSFLSLPVTALSFLWTGRAGKNRYATRTSIGHVTLTSTHVSSFKLFCTLLPTSPYFPRPQAPGNHFSTLCEFDFFTFFIKDTTYKRYHVVFAFVWCISITIMLSRSISIVTNGRNSSFHGGIMFFCVCVCVYVYTYPTSSLHIYSLVGTSLSILSLMVKLMYTWVYFWSLCPVPLIYVSVVNARVPYWFDDYGYVI